MGQENKLYQYALRVLARREYSVFELRQKLQTKTEEAQAIDALLLFLQNKNYLSDARFAESYITMRMMRGFGPVRIAIELRERGVAEELIAQKLAERESDWVLQVKQVHKKKFRGVAPSDLQERAKQIHFLQYRGFDFKHINMVLDDADE